MNIEDCKLNICLPKTDTLSDKQKQKVAKDFESLLTTELLNEMKNSIGNWGFETDGASEQLNGLFWMYLGRDIGQKGGLGLWKDIYKLLQGNENHNPAGQSLDNNL